MTKQELETMPANLRAIARDEDCPVSRHLYCAANCIEKLQDIIHRARVEFFRDGSDSKVMQRMIEILYEMP